MAKTKAMTVTMEPSPKAGEAITLLHQAQGLTISDRTTHEAALTFIKGAKSLEKEIEQHYATIKKPLNEARNTVLDLEKQHLAPVRQAIDVANRGITAYVREQERIEREAAETQRRLDEDQQRKEREREAMRAEVEALKLEASSDDLSARERVMVDAIVSLLESPAHYASPKDWEKTCRVAGYKDPVAAATKLIRSDKLGAAIAAQVQANAIRRESEAKRSAPIIADVQPVESQIGSVSGTSLRTYYGCGSVDLTALILAAAENIKTGDGSVALALEPNRTYLSSQARDLKGMFERVHPYARLVKQDKVAG